MKKKRSTKTRQSPKALIKSRRKTVGRGEHGFEVTEAGPGKFVLDAPASLEIVRSLRDELREVARDAIAAQGKNPDDWRKISRQSDEADIACIAAMLLGRLASMDRHRAALDGSDDVNVARLEAHAAVKDALSAAWLFNALGIVEHEVDIVAMEQSLVGASRGVANRAEKLAERNKELAEEYMEKRRTSRKSDTALMKIIGAKHDLSRSAAIAAIKKGLKNSVLLAGKQND